ncbi:MAG: ATP-dependent DNA helicase [Verrucomicrobiota bacterium]
MPLRFDETTKTLTVSVRELAETGGFHHVGFERGESWNRLGLGADLHSQVLKSRHTGNAAYLSEVHLEQRVAVGEWTAIITGRLDGCVPQEDGVWLVEEFKSAYAPSTHIRPFGPGFERHRRQLLIYCHLWWQLGHSPVHAALVYLDIATGKEFPFEIPYDAGVEQRVIETRLLELIAIWKAEEIVRKRKALIAANLPFPHSSPRSGQAVLIAAIRAAVQSQENLLAEAPTGSGKTAAGLHPALAEALSSGRQLYFLTAKTLQQKMAGDALIAMNRAGGFRTLQMRSKEKMCANDRVICHEDFCPYARNYPEKMEKSKLLERLIETQPHHDPAAVFDEAKLEKVCPFEVQLELASRADAVVADYNYIFDPGVSMRELDDLENTILLVDEAHNLPDRARQIYSPELREEHFQAALNLLDEQKPKTSRLRRTVRGQKCDLQAVLLLDETVEQTGYLFDEIGETFRAVMAQLQATSNILGEDSSIAETAPPEKELREIWKLWEARFIEYLSWKRENKVVATEDMIVDCHFALQRFISTLNLFGPGFSCVVERTNSGIRLAIICLDPARPLAPIFAAASSSILLSATLQPVETTRRVLGLDRAWTRAISLPPPFPRENRRILILPQVRTTFGAREKNFPRIATLVAEMAEAVPGNVLVLFPSYIFLSKVAELMPSTSATLLRQRPNVPDVERQEILRALSSGRARQSLRAGHELITSGAHDVTLPPSAPQRILLFAVLGGMYAEGVDYPGELLSAVFVVSPALPQVSFERELLRRYFDDQEGAGFDYAYLQPGMTRVIQAAGRLIRSETDRGVIALICQRFLQMPYADYVPKDWFDETPAELIAQNPAEEIRKFFST